MDIEQVSSIFLTIIVEFLVELYLFYGVIFKNLKRKDNFAIRLIIGFVITIILSFFLSIFYHYFAEEVWVKIFIYILLFSITLLHVFCCIDESLWTISFGCLMAYASQNLIYKSFLFIFCAAIKCNLIWWWGDNWSLWYRIFYYLFFFASFIGIYHLFIKKISTTFSKKELNIQLLIVTIIVLFVTVILCSIDDSFFAKLSSDININYFEDDSIFILRETSNLLSIICCVTTLLLMSKTIEEDNLKQEVRYLQHVIRQGEKQYQISKETIDMINIKCHDIKYKLNSTLLSNETETTMKDIENFISIYDANIETGNNLLNVLFTEKSLYCEQKGIKFTCMIDGKKLDFIEDGDLYCLFGNIIDNAIEAVVQIDEMEKRIINVIVKSKGDLILLQSENFYTGELTFENGLPITTKNDKNYHGFGMQSIRMIVEKYNGTMTTFASNNIFHLNILFNLQDVSATK